MLETSKNTDVNLKESNNIIIKRILKIIFLLNFIGVMLLINGPLYHGSESRPRAPAVLFRFRRDPSGRMRLCQLVCIFSPLSAHLIGMSFEFPGLDASARVSASEFSLASFKGDRWLTEFV